MKNPDAPRSPIIPLVLAAVFAGAAAVTSTALAGPDWPGRLLTTKDGIVPAALTIAAVLLASIWLDRARTARQQHGRN